LIWISEFTLPVSRANNHYGIQFDEVDLHFPDEAYEPGAIPDPNVEPGTPADLNVVECPCRFSLTIDLEHGLQPPTSSTG
jgi:hypothetical protein